VGALVEVLEANPELFAADPLQYNWEGDRVIHARTVMEPAASAREMFSRTMIPVPPLKMNYTADSSSVVPVPWGSAGSLMVRRRLFDALGGWDESFFIDMEDVDLCWRAWLRGWPTVYVPNARLNHKWGASNDDQLLAAKTESVRRQLTRRDFDRLVRQQRNHLRFALKVLDASSVLVLIGMKLVRLGAVAPRYPRVALATAVALAKFIGDIPVSLSARRRIAKTATSSSRAIIQRFGAADLN
jgi:GT2 family glycosyltransferase